MADFVFPPPDQGPAYDVPGDVAADPFWPPLNLAETRARMRLVTDVTKARLYDAIEGAMLTVAGELAPWAAAQQAAGFASLADITTAAAYPPPPAPLDPYSPCPSPGLPALWRAATAAPSPARHRCDRQHHPPGAAVGAGCARLCRRRAGGDAQRHQRDRGGAPALGRGAPDRRRRVAPCRHASHSRHARRRPRRRRADLMATIASANAGEPLDALIWRTIGAGPEALPAVLAANPGLAASSQALAEGTPVTIPDAAASPATVDLVQLWD